jgi:predicted nucleotidyltransferase
MMEPVATGSLDIAENSMKTVAYTVGPAQREDLQVTLRIGLEQEPAVRFAYLYGSVLESDRIHDVDVGVFLDDPAVQRQAAIIGNLSAKLTSAVGIPIDVRVLNEAPLSFLYHVLRGRLLLCRDEGFLTDLIEDVARRYLDLAPLLSRSTKDAFAA